MALAFLLILLVTPFSAGQHVQDIVANTATTDINASLRKNEILNEIFNKSGYDPKIRPVGANGSGPVHVYIDLYLRNIENVDDGRMDYTVQLTYRQTWTDPRLRFDHIQPNLTYLNLLEHHLIWIPDVFFENEKKGILHKLVTPNIFTRIFPQGGIKQSYRFTLLLSCPMDLSMYPLDIQTCPIMLSTYGYSTRDIMLDWSEPKPIQAKQFRMPQFRITAYKNRLCSPIITTVDSFSCLIVEVEMKRAFGFFLIQFYIPCAMVVLVSWVGCWLEPTAVEARVSLGVTTILTIVSQTYGINQNVPPASYIKALDIWTATCQILIFGGLIQFALVNYTSQLTSPMLKRLRSITMHGTGMDNPFEQDELEQLKFGIEKAKRIDRISRVLFPTIFLAFNIFYWTSYGAFL